MNYYQTPKSTPDSGTYSTVQWIAIIGGLIVIGLLVYQYLESFTANLPDPNYP